MSTMEDLLLVARAHHDRNRFANCTLATCPIQDSYFAYRPSLAANGVLLALFSFSLTCFILQAALSKRFIGFTIAMVSGCIIEVIGYVGRIISYHNPFNQVNQTLTFRALH